MLRAWMLVLAGCGRVGFGAGEIEAGDAPLATDLAPVPPHVRFGNRSDADVIGVVTDTLVDSSLPMTNFGRHGDLHFSAEPVLLRVDVSTVPQYAIVTRARLLMTVSAFPMRATAEIRVYQMREAWTEGTADETPGISNYTLRSPGVGWAVVGVGAPGSRDAMPVTTLAGPLAVGSMFVLELPPPVVQEWIAQPASNFGIAILTQDTPTAYTEVWSSDSPDQGDRPLLDLELR